MFPRFDFVHSFYFLFLTILATCATSAGLEKGDLIARVLLLRAPGKSPSGSSSGCAIAPRAIGPPRSAPGDRLSSRFLRTKLRKAGCGSMSYCTFCFFLGAAHTFSDRVSNVISRPSFLERRAHVHTFSLFLAAPRIEAALRL